MGDADCDDARSKYKDRQGGEEERDVSNYALR